MCCEAEYVRGDGQVSRSSHADEDVLDLFDHSSCSVHLCETALEAVAAFQSIDGHMNGLGHVNEGALCQEFLIGTEYVLDGVCRDGIYKVS